MNVDFDFTGRVALVTGSARGIGRASAVEFARHGAKVVVADVLNGDETVAEIAEGGGEASWIECDVGNASEVARLVDRTVDQYGRLDFAHNNAGVFSPAPVADLPEDEFEQVIRVNLVGVFNCMKHEIRHMVALGGGAIVNTASIWGFVGAPSQAAYVASKHGVVGLTKTAAIDHGSEGVRINAVAPGPIETEMTAKVPPDALREIVSRTVGTKMGQPEDIARAVAWLCSDGAGFVNGAILPVDDGWLAG